MKKIKNTIKNFISKIKKKLNDLIYKLVTKPYLDKKVELNKIRELKALRNGFEKQFNVKIDDIKRVNKFLDKKSTIDIESERLEAVNKINKLSKRHVVLNYNPEICEIHNENPDRLKYPDLKHIIAKESELTKKLLDEQSSIKKKKLALSKGEFIWLTRQ